MSDPLSDRLKRLAKEHKTGEQAERDTQQFQQRVNDFISSNCRPEYDRLLLILRARVEAINPELGDLPRFQAAQNGEVIKQGNVSAYLHLDKPILNLPNNALLISFGAHQNAFYFDDRERPEPERYRLVAAASDNIDKIIWVGDLGELTSEQLADLVLEQLTNYYLQHKPR